MAKKARATPAQTPTESEAIAAAIHRLADTIIVLRDAIAEIREDVQWVTQNGLPLQPIVHTVVRQMARDPCAANWSEQLSVDSYSYPRGSSNVAEGFPPLDRIRDELETTIEAVAQGQLDIVLAALDNVRSEILAALKRKETPSVASAPVPAVEAPAPTTTQPVLPQPPAPRGRLF